MGHTWIIAVVDDLRTYAELNDLPDLAAALRDVAETAAEEIALTERGAPAWARGHAGPGTRLGTARGRAGAR